MIRHKQNRTSTLEKAEFLPSLDGQISSQFTESFVQPLLQKYFGFSEIQIRLHDLSIPSRKRGVGHRHERWGGMRWTRQRPRAAAIAGRVLSIRERSICTQTNGAEAYGKIVWS
jgi:hypothetical protein